MSVVFNISTSGQNADTTNPNNLVVTSLKKELKITKQESGVISIPDGSWNATVAKPHGLGYEPAFMAYFKYPDDSTRYWIAGTFMGNLGLSDYDSKARVNKQNIYLTIDRSETGSSSGAVSGSYIYILFDQPAVMGVSGNDKPIGYTQSNQGLIVSQEGINANEAKLYEQQFNSNTDYLKYHTTKTGRINYDNTSNGASTTNITHNLGYVPLFMMYGKSTEETFYSSAPQGKVPLPFIASAGADKTNITINLVWAGGGSGAESFLWRVVIFKNKMII